MQRFPRSSLDPNVAENFLHSSIYYKSNSPFLLTHSQTPYQPPDSTIKPAQSTRTHAIKTMPPSADEKSTAKMSGHKSEDVEGSHNDWKFRAPYLVHTNDSNFKSLYDGSCHCGRVQYQLSREKPLYAKYCHCSTC